jgi:hypothetical protein
MVLKKEYQVFVDEIVKHGDPKKAVMKAYPKTKGEAAISKQCHRLSKNVYVQAAIKERSQKIEAIATQKAAEELSGKIVANTLTAMRKREILQQIAEGSLEVTVRKPVFDKESGKWVTVPVKEMPDHSTRMRAIDLDNKMAGDYAPEKKDLNLNGSFLDFLMSTD